MRTGTWIIIGLLLMIGAYYLISWLFTVPFIDIFATVFICLVVLFLFGMLLIIVSRRES